MATDPVAVAETPRPVPMDPARSNRASRLATKIRDSRWVFLPDGSIEVMPMFRAYVAGPTVEELAEIEPFLPDLKAIFFPPPTGEGPHPYTRAASVGEGRGKGKPRVPSDARASVVASIGRLPGATNLEVLATARELAAALGPHRDDARTESTFVKWCGQARSGLDSMSVAILIDAFEGACGKRPERRGAVFVHLVKEYVGEARRRGRSPSPT